ncbi:MAG: hypothetical protein PHV82_15660 [Victivallaceae bacterium]|nr:hypothetical protein [Victivallaceae bacterium]
MALPNPTCREQELVCAGLKALERLNPERGNGLGLVAAAVKSRLNAILISRYAQKRDWRKCSSLNAEISGRNEDEDASSLVELLPSNGNFGLPDKDGRNPAWKQLRCRDVNTAIGYLPPELRKLCEDLKTMTSYEIMAERNLTKAQFDSRLAKIRHFFLCFLGADEFGDQPKIEYRPL